MKAAPLLRGTGLCVDAPGGRALFRDLNLSVGRERVAIIGRNGSGKSTLLEVLAGHEHAAAGQVSCTGSRVLVRQQLVTAEDADSAMSQGELRKSSLEEARRARPDLQQAVQASSPSWDAAGANL